MAIKELMADIAKAMAASKSLSESMESLNRAKDAAFSQSNGKMLRQLDDLQAKMIAYNKSKAEYNELEEKANEIRSQSRELNREQQQNLKKLNDEMKKAASSHRQATQSMVKDIKATTDAENEKERALAEQNEAIRENWRQNTKAGKVYSVLTGTVGQLTAGLTAGAAAYRLMNRWTEAATTAQNIMVKSFRGVEQSGMGAVSAIFEYESVIRTSNATAIRFGRDTSEVTQAMEEFARMTGTKNPKALGAMTDAALATSTALNLSMGQTLEFVQQRMDKFGGTTASAIMALDEIRKRAERTNNTFQRTVLRTDDLVNMLTELSSASGVYAIDQRQLSSMLERTMTRLQGQGEAYNYAKERAMDYTKAVTSDAPEFMKVQAGIELQKSFADAFANGGASGTQQFMEKFGNELDKAKPGLSRRVMDIMESGMPIYEQQRIIQELVGTTEMGMDLINDRIVSIGKNSILPIKELYGVTYEQAQQIYNQAVAEKEIREELGDLATARYEDFKKTNLALVSRANLTEQEFKHLQKTKEGREKLLEIITLEEQKMKEEKRKKQDILRLEEKIKGNIIEGTDSRTGGLDQQINAIEKQIERAEAAGMSTKYLTEHLEEMESKRSEAMSKLTQLKDPDAFIPSLKRVTDNLSENFKSMSMAGGKWFLAKAEEWSTGAFVASLIFFHRRFQKGLMSFLAGFEAAMARGSSGFGSGGGPRSRKFGKFKKTGQVVGNQVGKGVMNKLPTQTAPKRGLSGLLDKSKKFLLGSKGKGRGIGAASSKLGGLAGKLPGAKALTKLGGKGLAAVPLLGSLVSAGMIGKNVWDIATGDPEERAANIARLTGNTAAMLDPTGAVAMGTMGMELSGGYDKIGDWWNNDDSRQETARGTSKDITKSLRKQAQPKPWESSSGQRGEISSTEIKDSAGDLMLRIPKDQVGEMFANMMGMANRSATP